MLAKARAAAGADDLVPIIVDNAESVTELLPVDSQVIRLVVSAEDESLRVEVDK